jgi:hypothetical protein
MSTTSDEFFDPFEAHFRREPMAGAAVRVVVLAGDVEEAAARVAGPLETLIAQRGRAAESVVLSPDREYGWDAALAAGLEGATAPLVLVTTATRPWTSAHLDPLLAAIDHCDHVVGGRRDGPATRAGRWLGRLPWYLVFGVPVHDVHSPCRLHRREKLAAIPLQSASAFLDVEILAKATFFGQLIDEVPVPPLDAWRGRPRPFGPDVADVFRRPVFLRPAPSPSGPAEDPQGDDEGADGPGGEDRQGGGDVEPAHPLEDHAPEGVEELGQGERLDQGLHRRGEPVGGEEDAREQPHREHHEVHQAADGLGARGAAADEQADPGEGQRPDHIDDDQ